MLGSLCERVRTPRWAMFSKVGENEERIPFLGPFSHCATSFEISSFHEGSSSYFSFVSLAKTRFVSVKVHYSAFSRLCDFVRKLLLTISLCILIFEATFFVSQGCSLLIVSATVILNSFRNEYQSADVLFQTCGLIWVASSSLGVFDACFR